MPTEISVNCYNYIETPAKSKDNLHTKDTGSLHTTNTLVCYITSKL